jgi:hypothetical protein
MSETNSQIGTFHDALTGETITRELTIDEIEAIPKSTELLDP